MEWSLKTTEDRPQKPPLVLRLAIPFLLILFLAWGLSHWVPLPEESLSLTELEFIHLVGHHEAAPVYLEEPFFISGTVASLGNGCLYFINGTRIDFPSRRIPKHIQQGADVTLKVALQEGEDDLILKARMSLPF